jgi:hypothetical protein
MMVMQETAPAQPTEPAVEDELVRLATMPIPQLRIRYWEVFRTDPPKAFGPDLLRRSIAHQIQEKAYGGLSRPVQRLLDHSWMRCLHDGVYESVELLAEASRLHPKVVRQALRLAFLSPEVTSAILEGKQPAGLTLARVPKLLPLSWMEHRRLLGCALNTDAIKRAKSPLAAP